MFYIVKQFNFCAAHRLPQLPKEHKCSKVHGHNWIVQVKLESEKLDKYSFVKDFGELKMFQSFLDEVFDHSIIVWCEDEELKKCIEQNKDIFKVCEVDFVPSAENFSTYFQELLKQRYPEFKISVSVFETPTNEAGVY